MIEMKENINDINNIIGSNDKNIRNRVIGKSLYRRQTKSIEFF